MKLITERRWGRFHPQNSQYSFCSGSKLDYQENYREDGFGFIEWTAPASQLPIETIHEIVLLPTKAQLKKAVFPAFLSNLTRVQHAVFALNFLYNRQAEKLPLELKSLVLSRDLGQPAELSQSTGWDTLPPGLQALLIIGDQEKLPVTGCLSQEKLPRLEHLAFTFTHTQELEVFQRFSSLTDLELTNLRDYPILQHVAHLPLVSLDLSGTTAKFDPSGLAKLSSLQMLRLNGLRCEFDCQLLGQLSNLQELVVLNSKKLRNVESLLQMKQLTRLSFLDCANPFKGGLYQRFIDHGFQEFDARYA